MKAILVSESLNQRNSSNAQDLLSNNYTSEEILDLIQNDERLANWEKGVLSVGPLYTDKTQRETVPGEYNNITVYGGNPNPKYSEFEPIENLAPWVADVEQHHSRAIWTIEKTGYGYLNITWDHEDQPSDEENLAKGISAYYDEKRGQYTGD